MKMSDWDRWTTTHPGVAFMLGNGIVGLVAGTVLLFGDGRVVPHGRSCLVVACGVILLAGAALELLDIETSVEPRTVVAGVFVVALFGLAALYFTHPAEDLPRFLIGHDGDSQHLRVLDGAASACAALVALRFAYVYSSPRRRPTDSR